MLPNPFPSRSARPAAPRPPCRPFLERLEDRLTPATLPSGFTESLVAGGLNQPSAMDFAPDGRLFIAEKVGTLRVVDHGALQPTPFVSLNVNTDGERGLLGVTFDPHFAANQFVYVYYTVGTAPIHNRISRFTAHGDVAVPGSEFVLADLETLGPASHNGGAIHFGPDGKLYAAVGNNGINANSQTLTNRLGKLLRLNADGSIPTDNPFYNQATGVNRAIWALGLRNPFTFAFQPGTGRLFINDVGEETWEEIDDGVAGGNYGWPIHEGFANPPDPNYLDPFYVYPHNGVDAAIAGGAFYNPTTMTFPAADVGSYFFADYSQGWIHELNLTTRTATAFASGIDGPVDLKVSADGSLYYLALTSGQLFRVQPRGGAAHAVGSVGAFDPHTATWYLKNSNTVGTPDLAPFAYGAPGWIPVAGDWDGDGKVTIGVFDPRTATWYLKNSNTAGAPDIPPFRYGMSGWTPVVGDWDGNGTVTIGVFDPHTATWYLKNSNTAGAPDIPPFRYGMPGWTPVVGDWDGDGITTVGVFDPHTATWYLKSSNAPGAPSVAPFAYGAAGWVPVAGDWDGDGQDSIGVFDPLRATWYLKNTDSLGAPDVDPFTYGGARWKAIPARWSQPVTAQKAAREVWPSARLLTREELNAVAAATRG